MKRIKIFMLLALFLTVTLSFTSCAEPEVIDECVQVEDASGFWSGLWHGMIAPISFIGSLIWDTVAIYDVNNNGGWYNFGFVLGIGAFSGGGSAASSRRRNR